MQRDKELCSPVWKTWKAEQKLSRTLGSGELKAFGASANLPPPKTKKSSPIPRCFQALEEGPL